MNLASATILILALIAGLFALASVVEKSAKWLEPRINLRHLTYTLALGVYCTSWTFYGAVGSAVRDGWSYLPIYLAPFLLLLLAPKFLRQLSEAVAREQATSVSDFVAARFGHDIIVAQLVTIIALLGSIPYVALQLRSIGNAMAVVSSSPVEAPTMIAAALLLAAFAMLFGARRYELAGRSEGLVYAIGVDSLIKIISLAVVAALAAFVIFSSDSATIAAGSKDLLSKFQPERLSIDVAVIFLISAMAIIALPRQFYMGLVEARDTEDLPRARFGLALYVALMALMVVPIAIAGTTVLGGAISPDLYVLQLPAATGDRLVVAAALIGGVSAAASMAIVDTTALATMVSNDLVLSRIVRSGGKSQPGRIGRQMLWIRRCSILAIMVLALSWALLVSPSDSLASIGLISFAAMAQFTPHLILAARSGGRDPLAARASLLTGLAIWFYTLALPPILPDNVLSLLALGPLDPNNLFGIGSASPLVHGVFWSLGANLCVFAIVSARGIRTKGLPRLLRGQGEITDLQGLIDLTANFIGRERTLAEFPNADAGGKIDRKSAQRAQELISRVVGVSAARTLVASALAGGKMSLTEVTRLLDEGGQSLRFSRQLLASTFENVEAGISVVDVEMNLVAWNTRYLDLFDYPPGMVRVGAPVADLIAHNAARGDFGPGDAAHHVAKRLAHLRAGMAHSFERRRADGRVIKTVGGPMPGGGYVMSFTDITSEAKANEELKRTLDELETRVLERTMELSSANRRLAKADREKTRFLAAASHDLLQPLHAARLFTSALGREANAEQESLIKRVDAAIIAAENLLRALLDISRLDAGGVTPNNEKVNLREFLTDMVDNFRPLAAQKGLELRLGALHGTVETDLGLLRSIMQNFLSNAVRYTNAGGIVIGVRRRGAMLRIDVVDTGVGIAASDIESIFAEFTRLGHVEAEGHGLGLALAERIARLIGGQIEVASNLGRGSRFSLLLPPTLPKNDDESLAAPPIIAPSSQSTSFRKVLVLDNDRRIVDATSVMLRALGHEAFGAHTIAEGLAHVPHVDVILADYRLDNGEDGLTFIAMARKTRKGLPALLITAESGEETRAGAKKLGVKILEKPARPEAIKQFICQIGT